MFSKFITAATVAFAALVLAAPGAQAASSTFSNNTKTTFAFQTDPFPSSIPVAGLEGEVTKVTVALNGYTITDRADATDVLLVGPQGQNTMLMSDAGGQGGTFNRNLVFDDAAVGPVSAPLVNAGFKPTNFDKTDDNGLNQAPAPPPPYGSALSNFVGTDANGSWSLFIRHTVIPGNGSLKGWSLTIETKDAVVGEPPKDELSLELTTPKQKLSRKLSVKVAASEAGELRFSGKARGSVDVAEGRSTVSARLDPGAFKKLKRKLKGGKKASVVIEATLKDGQGETADDSSKAKVKAKKKSKK